MALFRRGRSPNMGYPQEVNDFFGGILTETQELVVLLSSSEVTAEQVSGLFPRVVEAGLGWTHLAKDGYFLSISEPYSKAFAEITFGVKENDRAHIAKGLQTITEVAKRLIS